MNSPFKGFLKLKQAQETCKAIRVYREYKADVERSHPNGIPDERRDVKAHLASLKEAKNTAYLKWLEMEVNPDGH